MSEMKNPFKLGFGLMRLPRTPEGPIDVEQVKTMVDMFLAAGGTYFDTAFAYQGSEEAIKAALVDRYPRDSYTLATKLIAWGANSEDEAKKEFETSLARTGAGYIDYYLLHAIQRSNYQKYDEFHIWDYVKELKEKGLVKHYGFSFHGDPELLEELLQKHPDAEFVQLQINYTDWEDPNVQARANWEICRAHGKPVVIMEPVKGGALADPIPQVKKIFDAANPNASYASWAIRYAAGLDGILAVLSGMSNIAQMEDNLSYMKGFKPLDEAEQAVIKDVLDALSKVDSIKCTACSYCTKGCPMNIPIPDIFRSRNSQLIYNQIEGAKGGYARATNGKGKASDCIQCGQCEGACPQHLPIIELLQDCAANLE